MSKNGTPALVTAHDAPQACEGEKASSATPIREDQDRPQEGGTTTLLSWPVGGTLLPRSPWERGHRLAASPGHAILALMAQDVANLHRVRTPGEGPQALALSHWASLRTSLPHTARCLGMCTMAHGITVYISLFCFLVRPKTEAQGTR